MSDRKFKICDPLYDYIYLEEYESRLLNHFIFQRLRSIRQLGFAEQAFPSGTHNRFSHSLGACHLAGQAFDSIFNKNKKLPLSESKKEAFKKLIRVSALLHDIGHGPLSHSSESLMPPLKELKLKNHLNSLDRQARHEDYSLKFIMEKEGLYNLIRDIGIEPLNMAQLLHPEFSGESDFFEEGGLNFLPILRQIISSPFDVDRMDYLYRDSLSCGVKYGLIDFVWLISHFDCHIEKKQVFLAIEQAALYTLESLILGRQHMRLIVYFHHKSTIYNQMLKNYSKDCNWSLSPNLSDYAEFTDIQLFEKLKSDQNEWARRIVERRPYLRLYESIHFEGPSEKDEYFPLLKEQLKREGLDFIELDSEQHSIKPSKNDFNKLPVYLKNKALNQIQELNKAAAFLALAHRTLQRIYVKSEDFSKAKNLLKKIRI